MEEIDTLRRMTQPEEYEAAQALLRQGAVRFIREEDAHLLYAVGKEESLAVRLSAGELPAGVCRCGYAGEGFCRHTAAAMVDALQSGRMTLACRHCAEENTRRLREASRITLPMEQPLQLEVTLFLPEEGGKSMALALRTGQDKLYAVRSVAQFFSGLESGAEVIFSKSCTLNPSWRSYSEQDRELLSFLWDIVTVMSLSGQMARTGAAARLLPVPERFILRLMGLLSSRRFRIRVSGKEAFLNGIPEGRVDLLFAMTLHGREIEMRAEAPEGLRKIGRDAAYVFCDGTVLRLPEEQRLILSAMQERRCLYCFSPEESMWALCELLPQMRRAGHVVLEGRLKDRLVNQPLTSEVRLDREGLAVTCEVDFHYGETVTSPFSGMEHGSIREDGLLLVRDAEGEHRVLKALADSGFRMNRNRAELTGGERIWAFLTEGLGKLQEVSTLWFSEAFKTMKPRRPHLAGRLTAQGSGLRLELNVDGEPAEDTEEILKALREKRHWFRLADGAFLDLSGMEEWEDFADAALEQAPEPPVEGPKERGILEICSYRAAYLLSLLSENHAEVEVDQQVTRLYAMKPEQAASGLDDRLRPYQARGYAWLRTLHRMHLGGILADDMGLGKTIQIIALLLWGAEEKPKKPSVIVAPTSLLYNWATELERFAPVLSVLIADGGQPARGEQISTLTDGAKMPDVYLTSYPLMRRDIPLLRSVPFRFAILDEAQYIKNAASAGAGAAKSLTAETRFALTGTPMENHPGELWSIFDFVLPGYLGTFSSFMQRYGLGGNAERLRERIRPFLLRRLKEEVLTELPEKTETVLMADMTPEQDRVYRAALSRLRPEERQLSGAARFRVLSALTELRECCDHPSLILPDYAGSSGKMELLMDILPGALASGRRVLLFSQFTRMLRILERRLIASGVSCFYLDGETPARTRMDMVNRFNAGTAQVFLISLKAGGSGLNLTGADWVIHYDPWWNPAAEDQATDRAHRIGQSRPVTVTRLITHGTVEEQVMKLSGRKREIFDRMIEAGETFPTQLSDEEIRGLFEEGEAR